MKKMREWKAIFNLYRRALIDSERYTPGRLLCTILNALFESLSPYATIWISAQLINELATHRRPEVLIRWAVWTICITAIIGIIRVYLKHWSRSLEALFYPMKNKLFFEKFLTMDYADVDSQHIRKLKAQINHFQTWQGFGLNKVMPLTQQLIGAVLGFIGAIVLTISLFTQDVPQGSWDFLNHPLSAIVLLGIMAVITRIGTGLTDSLTRKESEMSESSAFSDRMYSAYCGMMIDKRRRLDVRTYNQQKVAAVYLQDSVFGSSSPLARLTKGPYGILASVGKGMGSVFVGFVYVFTCMKAWAGAFSVGSVTQYVSAVTALSSNISIFGETLSQIRSNHRFLEITYELLDTPNKMCKGNIPVPREPGQQYEFEFKNVSFKYPGSDVWALRNLNMKFNFGKSLSIVGENGSGKTTFIKLLCRLYDPQEGKILLNGVDIRKYRYHEYMNLFSVVFQDFQLLSQPIGANVAGCEKYIAEHVFTALRESGFSDRLESLPYGINTMVYKDFNETGVDISGGEAQKIAIARALYRDVPFVILDEPTAALDPMAEAEVYAKINDIAGERSVIFISHRLSSCRFCDEIVVFHEGSVIQQGSHSELLEEKALKYHELWSAQAMYYTDKS